MNRIFIFSKDVIAGLEKLKKYWIYWILSNLWAEELNRMKTSTIPLVPFFLDIVKALVKLRIDLLGIPIKIVTHYNAFKVTKIKAEVYPKIFRWTMFLKKFSYEMENRPGTPMKHTDALSRIYWVIYWKRNKTMG